MKKYNLFEMKLENINVICIMIVIVLTIITPIIDTNYDIMNINLILLIILMIPYFILHEIIHSLSYIIFGAKPKNITFGVHLEKGILCCLCKQNVTKNNILISLLSPFIIIGVITYIVGIIISNDLLIFLSIINMAGSAADLVMFYHLSKLKNFEFSEYDNPVAFAIYTKEDLSNKKLWGLKYIGNKKELEKTTNKKITISKTSTICFVIILILLIIEIIRNR